MKSTRTHGNTSILKDKHEVRKQIVRIEDFLNFKQQYKYNNQPLNEETLQLFDKQKNTRPSIKQNLSRKKSILTQKQRNAPIVVKAFNRMNTMAKKLSPNISQFSVLSNHSHSEAPKDETQERLKQKILYFYRPYDAFMKSEEDPRDQKPPAQSQPAIFDLVMSKSADEISDMLKYVRYQFGDKSKETKGSKKKINCFTKRDQENQSSSQKMLQIRKQQSIRMDDLSKNNSQSLLQLKKSNTVRYLEEQTKINSGMRQKEKKQEEKSDLEGNLSILDENDLDNMTIYVNKDGSNDWRFQTQSKGSKSPFKKSLNFMRHKQIHASSKMIQGALQQKARRLKLNKDNLLEDILSQQVRKDHHQDSNERKQVRQRNSQTLREKTILGRFKEISSAPSMEEFTITQSQLMKTQGTMITSPRIQQSSITNRSHFSESGMFGEANISNTLSNVIISSLKREQVKPISQATIQLQRKIRPNTGRSDRIERPLMTQQKKQKYMEVFQRQSLGQLCQTIQNMKKMENANSSISSSLKKKKRMNLVVV